MEKNKNVTVPNLQIGAPANLSYKMDIYPEPKNDDYEWTIYDKSTNTKIEVKPGTKFDTWQSSIALRNVVVSFLKWKHEIHFAVF